VFDSNRDTCDVLLHNESLRDNISRKHFRITINIDIKVLIVNDESIYDIVVTSRRLKKLMLRKALTFIFVYDDV